MLRTQGKTLIEAEALSAASEKFPYTEPCKDCSGGQNLGYFWKDSWFELQVQVPRDGDFELSMRASSEQGTSVEILKTGDESSQPIRIDVPKTRDWRRYTLTDSISLHLTAGRHTLRFLNLVDGANIDYITFAATSNTGELVTYRPPQNAGPEKNPLKGFSSGWWRPHEDFATVGFQYIEWGLLEPQDDQFDWKYVEEVIGREGTRGRHLILQFVVDWDYRVPVEENYLGPDWLLDQVGEHRGNAIPGDTQSRPMRATKYNDPIYIEEATEAIAALTNYFQNDPRVFILQAGLLGFWSEWHTFPRNDWSPSDATKNALLNTYLSHLPRDSYTQIRYPNEPSITPRSGIGYANGSATLNDHGYEFGKLVEQRELWKNGPITGEWPPNVEHKYWERFFLSDEGEGFIQQAHYSTLLMPEVKQIQQQLPSWTPDERFMSMHRQMGYNFQVEQVRHGVNESGTIDVQVTLSNCGIAPFYGNWELQLAILDSAGRPIDQMKIETDLRRLAPGKSIDLQASTSKKLDSSGNYQIGLRILQPGADRPKPINWDLEPRNVYVVIANEVEVIPGIWGQDHALFGGWNLLGSLVVHSPASQLAPNSFPFRGSYRPVSQ